MAAAHFFNIRMKTKKATLSEERSLNDIVEDSIDIVRVRNKSYSISWMKNGTKRKMTQVILNEKDDDKVSCKCASVIILNGYWSIKFLYWILWRWFYYFLQYGEHDLTAIIETGKKKIHAESYLVNTILLTDMRDTIKTMTREEVEHIRQGLSMEQHTPSEKSTTGS